MRNKKLYLVIPCYNEEEVLPETAMRLKEKLTELERKQKIDEGSRILFVNDGSRDRTWEIIRTLHEEDPCFGGINLSRNRGHQNALLAGLMTAKEYADMVISMDADLQDDINAVDDMIDKYLEGIDIVYGVRSSRKKDTFFKRATAEGFYKLMSRRALEGLSRFQEVNLFLRGIVPMIGFSWDVVYYERGERFAGESKYPFGKMISFAVEGITSLSTRPIRMITGLGFIIFLVSIGILIYSLVRHYMGATIVGWTTLMVSVWAIGGLILLSLGVVGEYVGKIYLETKSRPRYIIEEILNQEK